MKSLTPIVASSFYSSCCLRLIFASLLFTLCFSHQNSSDNKVECILTERLALIQFKDSLEDRGNHLSSWSGEDCCSWLGVVCDNFTHHVHELRLRGPDDSLCYESYYKQFQGMVSSSLIRLEQLRYLDLSCNDFPHISIPSFIGSLQNLRYLNLSLSGFAGEVPHQLGNLSALLVLDFHHLYHVNHYSENLKWIENLKQLQYLDMSKINLTRASNWLQAISTLPSLQELHLSKCDLTQIPSEPTKVSFNTSLILLDISGNDFSGNLLPEWVFSLRKLITLDLTGCHIGGLSPKSHGGFHSFPSLMNLRVSENAFVSTPSMLNNLSSLSNLRLLDVSGCDIYDPVLVKLQNLSLIVHLDLSENHIVEKIPKSLSNLCNLTTLDLGYNHFYYRDVTELLESFCECDSPKIEWLDLSGNSLSGRLINKLGRLKNLYYINLANNKLTGILPRSLGSTFSYVRVLDISHNNIKGKLGDVSNFSSPQVVLDLSFNRLYGELPRSFNKPDFYSLDLSSNNLSGSLDQFLCSGIQEPRRLRFLNLAYNNISGGLPDCWMNWENLTILNLDNNRISGKIPSSLGKIYRSVSLDNNKLSGEIPPSLLNSKSLWIVKLERNELMGKIPKSIGGNGTSLRILSLRSNKLSGGIPNELCGLSSIQILDLADNNLSGYLPKCFTNFTAFSGKNTSRPIVLVLYMEKRILVGATLWKLVHRVLANATLVTKGKFHSYTNILYLVTSVDLSDNNFTGPIPNELVSLPGLRYLNLSQNKLTGGIPNTFGEMRELESLDLSVNHLDGEIPLSLAELTALSLLNVSYNDLTGTIPTGRQFQTFNEKYGFIGNALCGAPLVACQQNNTDISNEEDDDEKVDDTDRILVICMTIGLVVGFWVTIGLLIVNKQWRDAYYRFLNGLWMKLSNFIFLISMKIHSIRRICKGNFT